MLKHYWSVLGGVAVTAAALIMSPAPALAQHGGHGGGGHGGGGHAAAYHGGGGWGGHGGYYGHGYYGRGYYGYGRGYGWGGWGWGWGWPWIGLGWYGGGWGGYYGSAYPYYGYNSYYAPDYYGYDNAYPSYAYGYSPDYSLDQSAPAYGYPDSEQPAATADNRAHIRVLVPADAQLWFQNRLTKETGPTRLFNSPALQPGHTYSYDIRAQWRQGDRMVTQDREITVYPGDRVSVDFLHAPANNTGGMNPGNSSGNPKLVPQTNPPPEPQVPHAAGK
jgi:uncharacterized protein (TIGR03000 family)